MSNWHDNIPAPVDANGREVPLDTKELVYEGEKHTVYRIALEPAGRQWLVDVVGVFGYRYLSDCTLPDSWERLEKDARSGLCEYFGMGDAPDCKGCPAYGDRLSSPCSSVMACDIIRRAKALAGVTDGE